MGREILSRATVALPAELLKAVDQLIRAGTTSNRNQFIAAAIKTELRRRERAAIDAEFALMASDPEYQAEVARATNDFRFSDDETWVGLDKQ